MCRSRAGTCDTSHNDNMMSKVRTASEFKALVRNRDLDSVKGTYAITCATMSVMDTATAEFSIRLPENIPSGYVDRITMNGIPVTPDMIRDGHLDCMILANSVRDMDYGIGHLFRDIVSGRTVGLEVETDGTVHRVDTTMEDMVKAEITVLYDPLTAMRAFVNDSPDRKALLYAGPNGLEGNMGCCSLIGCGEIEPLFNHRGNAALVQGDTVLLNGAKGRVIRSQGEEGDNGFIQISADMHGMDPRYMGGFRSPYGPLCVMSVATCLRLDHEDINRESVISDMGVPLPISNRNNMIPRYWSSYGDSWPMSEEVTFNASRCLRCDVCSVKAGCPMDAFTSEGIDEGLCLSCGSCVSECRGKAISGRLGHVVFDGRRVPVSIRLSSRKKAEELCIRMRNIILEQPIFDR